MENEVKKELTEVETVVEAAEEKIKAAQEAVEEVKAAAEGEACEAEAAAAEVVEEVKAAEEKAEEVVEEVKEIPAAVEEPAAEAPAAAPAAAAAVAPAAAAVEEKKPKAMGKRVASAILGCLGISTSWLYGIPALILGIISLALGFSAKKKSGKGKFAITLGFISLILGIIFFALLIYLIYLMFANPDSIISFLESAGAADADIDTVKTALDSLKA